MNNNNNYNDENQALCIITIKMINKNILPFKSQKWVDEERIRLTHIESYQNAMYKLVHE